MKNLAGVPMCDVYIRAELEAAGIPIVEVPLDNTEVPYRLIGQLGNFEFRRAWYYWIVSGRVPLEIAKELYANPIGKKDVRVTGHCGCPPPEDPWITYYDGKAYIISYGVTAENLTDDAYEHRIFIGYGDKVFEIAADIIKSLVAAWVAGNIRHVDNKTTIGGFCTPLPISLQKVLA